MSRKVFISVLGFTNYGHCIYIKGDYKSPSLRFIQEATMDYLCKQEEWTEHDVAYVLLTDGAEQANWRDNGHKDKNGDVIACEGLESRLLKCLVPCRIESIKNLPNGNTEEEIWQIFKRVYDVLEDGDELYFDLTHGFRYLPMLVMVLINYSKFLKKTLVRSITYGNYESRNRETNEAPIIDLLPLSALQDWTYAAGQFLDSGNASRLELLCNKELTPILKQAAGNNLNLDAINLRKFVKYLNEMIEERSTCRGLNIIKSDKFRQLKTTSESLDKIIIPPLSPVFAKIKQSFDVFDVNENVANVFQSAKWCFDNGLLQQAATILQEYIITFMCLRHSIRIDDESKREWVTSAFTIKNNNINRSKWILSSDETIREEQIIAIEKILNDDIFTNNKFVNAFINLSEVRNDYNHSGMRSKRLPMPPKRMRENIKKCIDVFSEFICTNQQQPIFEEKETMLINLTNHPFVSWDEKQKMAAKEYGRVVDVPFPMIDETADEDTISSLVERYLQDILEKNKIWVVTVHLMGELTFTFGLLKRLQEYNIPCIASTSKRIVTEEKFGQKKDVIFQFERFRKYE